MMKKCVVLSLTSFRTGKYGFVMNMREMFDFLPLKHISEITGCSF